MAKSYCRGCGAEIIWVKTTAGKSMPCDPCLIPFRAVAGGKERAVTMDGKVISCELRPMRGGVTDFGYVPHFATCPQARKFSKRK